MAWARYRSHKIVQAQPIVAIDSDGTETRLFVDGELDPFTPTVAQMVEKAAVGDYAVIYEDDYRSVSPKQVFEDGYTRLD